MGPPAGELGGDVRGKDPEVALVARDGGDHDVMVSVRELRRRGSSRHDKDGRRVNQYAYKGKTWVDSEKQGTPSKWVTVRACAVSRAVYG